MDREEMRKHRLYLSFLNLLRLRGLKIQDKELISNNEAILEKLKNYSSDIDFKLLEYFYSYLYINFEKLCNSYIYLGNGFVSVLKKDDDEDKITYTYNIITKVGEEDIPIKNEERVITYNKKDNNYLACKNTYYSTAQAIEMIKLETDSINYSNVGLSYAMDAIDDEVNTKVVFRNFHDYLLLTEVSVTSEGDKINYYETDGNDLSRIVRAGKVSLDEHINNYAFNIRNLRNKIVHGYYPNDTYMSIDFLRYMDNDVIDSIIKAGNRYNEETNSFIKEGIDYDKKVDVDLRSTLALNKIEDAEEVVDIMGILEKRNRNRER